jgi:hypothetical protein
MKNPFDGADRPMFRAPICAFVGTVLAGPARRR